MGSPSTVTVPEAESANDAPGQPETGRSTVVIFREHLGLYSETFIRDSARMLTRYVPMFAGGHSSANANMDEFETVVASHGGLAGKARQYLFTRWGIAPVVDRRLAERQPVLLHAHFGPDGATAMPFAARLNVPLLVTFHGYDITVTDASARNSFYAHRLYLRRRDELRRRGAAFLAVSRFVQRALIAQAFPEDRVILHQNSLDLELFQPDPTVRREPLVLFVGRLIEKKNCAELIDALGRLQTEGIPLELVVIGDGPQRASLERMAGERLPYSQFLGIQPPAAIRGWMSRARIFSVPSKTADNGDSETFGVVFLEAQAMGLPVASYAHGGIPEVVAHGETGLLATEGDVDGLAANLRALATDDDLWERLHRAGRQRVQAHFDLRDRTRQLEDLYDQVIASPTWHP